MFLSSKNYQEQFRNLVESSADLSLAVAFWGSGAETLIAKAWAGQTLRILCNLGSGGTNPQVIRELIELAKEKPGLQVLTLDDLHAKVAVSRSAAVVGSANISANGLGFEGVECSGWQEAGMLVDDQMQIVQIQVWFDDLWSRGEEITEERLATAQFQWIKNRGSRPIGASSFIEAPVTSLRAREIYVAVYQLPSSDQAKVEAAQASKDARRSDLPEVRNAKLDFFEDWPDDSEEPLPKDAPIIVMRYGSTKRVTCQSAWQRIPQLDREFVSNETGKKVPLIMTGRLELVAGLPFSKADGAELAKRLKPWIDDLYIGAESGTARCIPLDDFIEWERSQQLKG
ncbi:hypothetical protein D3C77_257580 [compost metagenome]